MSLVKGSIARNRGKGEQLLHWVAARTYQLAFVCACHDAGLSVFIFCFLR